ncbi:hypothetical protein PROFUN_06155 [Planoprotostelium fungivorum]|uniref:Uncharacterized protein n=1 Tax=Planoprotostelium fungivorum TaxID=1890364 RepID=A0A2P6NPJ7_9EUKA|nr:hypothetical protein PROFUN_06155 [Planoprotostelium fungivorum]
MIRNAPADNSSAARWHPTSRIILLEYPYEPLASYPSPQMNAGSPVRACRQASSPQTLFDGPPSLTVSADGLKLRRRNRTRTGTSINKHARSFFE